jgi:hypothetical protein
VLAIEPSALCFTTELHPRFLSYFIIYVEQQQQKLTFRLHLIFWPVSLQMQDLLLHVGEMNELTNFSELKFPIASLNSKSWGRLAIWFVFLV